MYTIKQIIHVNRPLRNSIKYLNNISTFILPVYFVGIKPAKFDASSNRRLTWVYIIHASLQPSQPPSPLFQCSPLKPISFNTSVYEVYLASDSIILYSLLGAQDRHENSIFWWFFKRWNVDRESQKHFHWGIRKERKWR